METAVTHAVDGLAGYPALLFVIGILIIAAGVSVAYFKVVIPPKRELEQKKLEIEATQFAEKLKLEREREQRKLEESKERSERDRESAAIQARSVDAQERSNVVMSEVTSQIAILNTKLDISQDRSASMGGKVDNMEDTMNNVAHEVHDLHKAQFGN